MKDFIFKILVITVLFMMYEIAQIKSDICMTSQTMKIVLATEGLIIGRLEKVENKSTIYKTPDYDYGSFYYSCPGTTITTMSCPEYEITTIPHIEYNTTKPYIEYTIPQSTFDAITYRDRELKSY